MLDGYQVNLTQLTFDTLIGHPQHAGPQSDFTEACRTFLVTYKDLYSQIHALNQQISGKLNYLVQAFVDTREQYQKLESDHAAVFDGLLDHIRGDVHDGAAGSR